MKVSMDENLFPYCCLVWGWGRVISCEVGAQTYLCWGHHGCGASVYTGGGGGGFLQAKHVFQLSSLPFNGFSIWNVLLAIHIFVCQMSCANIFSFSVACLLILFILLIFPHFCGSPTSFYVLFCEFFFCIDFYFNPCLKKKKVRPESGFIAFGCPVILVPFAGKKLQA